LDSKKPNEEKAIAIPGSVAAKTVINPIRIYVILKLGRRLEFGFIHLHG